MCLECFFLYERGWGHLFSVVSICLIGFGYTNAVRSMSTADWCVTPYSYCNNVVSNMYSIYQFYTLEIDMHFCNTPYTFMDVLVLSWLYTLDKWQLDNWKWDFYYMSWNVKKKKKGSIKILTEVRFVGPFLCSHVMKTLNLYEDMDLLSFSKDVSLLCFYVFVCVFLFPNISIRMGYLTLHS